MANNFVNSLTQNVSSASLVTVYNANASGLTSATILGCSVANTGNTPITADVAIQTASPATTTYLVRQATVPVGGSLVVIGSEQKVVLRPSQTLAVQPSASTCDVAVSALEITT